MKLTHKQLAGSLEHAALYLRHYGRLFPITALATTHDEANAHMHEHAGDGLLAEHQGFLFIAKNEHEGTEDVPLAELLRRLVRALEQASPDELDDAGRSMDLLYIGQRVGTRRFRTIARKLAPFIHGLRK